MKRPEQRHRDVVGSEESRLAVLAELADPCAQHLGPGQRGDAAHGVDDAGAGEVDVAVAQAEVVPELGEPAAAPRPGTEQRVVDGAAEETPDDEALELPALGHGPGGDGGGGVHEGDHVEEERHHRNVVTVAAQGRRGPGQDAAEARYLDGPRADRDVIGPGADHGHGVGSDGGRVGAEHDAVADQEEGDEAEAEDGEVRHHHVRRVFRPAEPGLDQGEAGLHEDDQNRADHDPQQVEADLRSDDVLAELRDAGAQAVGEGRLGTHEHPDRRENSRRRSPV